MSKETIQQTIASYFAATRAMDVEAWLTTFAEDAVSYDPVGEKPLEGRMALKQFFLGLTESFKSVGLTEDFVTIIGNQAAIKWTGHGLGKNGRSVTFEGIDIFEFSEAGQIKTLRAYWERDSLMASPSGCPLAGRG